MKAARFAGILGLITGLSASGLGGGCASEYGDRGVEANLGTAHLAVIDVPLDVSCIQIDAAGSTTVTTLVDVTPGQPADIGLTAQPVGLVAFSAQAFPSSCSVVTDSTVPTWISDTVYATLTPGVAFDLSLTLHENGIADVGVEFESGLGCHQADQACLTSADCCSGQCDSTQVCVGSCSPNGATCTTASDCCGGQCDAAVCCVPQGNACAMDADCCSGNCVDGACEAESSGSGGSGSLCDNSGTCGDASEGCVSCAFAGSCAAASDACLDDQDCLGFLDCVAACFDQACYDGCATTHPSGAAAYDALVSCIYCQECPVDCDPASLGVSCP